MKLTVNIVFLIFLMFMASCATLNTENAMDKAEAHYKVGLGYYNDSMVQQAFVEFQHAYELNPRNKEVLYSIGIIYLLDFDETLNAIDYFQRAIKIDPDYSEAYNNLGYAHARMGKFDAAIPFYKKALSNLLYATPEKAFVNMGKAYYRLGRCDEAVAAYKDATKRAPDFDLPYMGLALCYNATGKYVAFSEGGGPSSFIWEWVVLPNGDTWKITNGGSSYLEIEPIIYNKVAFSFLALYNTTFARNMVVYLESNFPGTGTTGYSEGGSDSAGSIGASSNTNSLILAAALYAIQNNP